jgi:glycosyltransferase involved in cell wall biosynthesis
MRANRILVLHPSDELYGADRVLLEALNAFDTAWHIEVWLPTDVTYASGPLSSELIRRGYTVRFVDLPVLRRSYLRPRYLPKVMRRVWRLGRQLCAFSPDAIYVNTAALSPAVLLGRLFGARVLLHLHEHTRGLERLALATLYAPASRIVAVSEAVQKTVPMRFQPKTTVIHNGFELQQFDGHKSPSGALVFVLASRWNLWKGHASLLRAWANVRRTDVKLVILGGPPVVGSGVDVRKLVAELPNRETVEVVGEVDDVSTILAKADAVLVPSVRPDPLPTIAIEAAAAGCAAFVSNLGGLPEIVEDEVTGLILPAGDEIAWSNAIESADRSVLSSYGRAAQDVFGREFSRAAFLDALRAELKLLVSS